MVQVLLVQSPVVQAPMAQKLLVQVSPILTALVQVPLEQIPLIQASGAGLLEKKTSKFVTLAKETVTPNKNVTFKEFLSSTQVFNSYFVNEIKDPYIKIDFYIRPLLKTLSLTGILFDSVVKLTSYYLHNKEISGMRKCALFL